MQQAVRSWILGCQATHPDQIIQLLLLEQFYNYSPPEVRDWVRDRRPLTLPEATRLADEYQDARRVPPPDIRPPPPRFHPAPQPRTAPTKRAPRPLTIQTPVPWTGPRCYGCNQIGHIRDRCPLNANHPAPHRPAHPPGRATAYCCQHEPEPTAIPDEDWGILHEADPIQAAAQDNRQHHRQKVRVNGRSANGLRDTGATLTLAQPHLITPAASTGYSVAVRVAGGHVYRIPTDRVHLCWGTEVGIMKDLPTAVLLDNDLGLLTSTFEDTHPGGVCPVTTRHQARKAPHTDSEGTAVRETSPTLGPDNTPSLTWDSPTDFVQATREDVTLASYRQQAGRDPGGVGEVRFAWDQGKLYRTSGGARRGVDQAPHRQLVVPGRYRRDLLKIGHDIPLAGHLGHRRTLHRLTQSFFWPGLSGDVRDYCLTCEVCQRVGKRGDTRKATLRPLPIVGEPFRWVAVDLIRPLAVPSITGKKYILTVVDYATRYPEAMALRDIHAETVAGALLQIFSRVGFPQEILSDQGTQFTAEVTQQLWRLCGIKPLYSSPYHPQTNGLCERFNGTLKQLLRTFTMSHLLFAYREVPQEATGFSPFELLYGRRVRGPLDLLR
uniref:Gypsy retrotransposon integrase-like protein 1 n=1 Tax=Leptobrachium leishanense TaxID=445787 RepID=A0A8C5LYB3_9ANUR